MLDWAAEMRGINAPAPLERAFAVTSQIADMPVGQVREFIDHVIRETSRIPEHFAKPHFDGEEQPLEITLRLTLSLDEALVDEFGRELERATHEML
jgi:hypothetical protein